MQVIESIEKMQSTAMGLRLEGQLISFVPTMGCLHAGHLSLIERARASADKLVVSIFVNPAQFGPNEDFDRYPRVLEQDLKLCEAHGVDIVFCPSVEAMYPEGYSTFVEEISVGKDLCGVSRPSFFKGVATVCLKLFNLVRPDFSFFGQKDAQQCAVLKKIVKDLNIATEIIECETVREPDGLAMSSRNSYLSDTQRKEALAISRALFHAKEMVDNGTKNADRIIAEITHYLSQYRRIRIIYVQVVHSETMQAIRTITPNQSLVCVAVWLDSVRLIDNITL